eukprot:4457959-Pleurochrysis_carterae.AAC.1
MHYIFWPRSNLVCMSKRPLASSTREEDDKYVALDDFGALYRALKPWQHKLIARKWIKNSNKYFGSIDTVLNR